jgi:hypothetical protein
MERRRAGWLAAFFLLGGKREIRVGLPDVPGTGDNMRGRQLALSPTPGAMFGYVTWSGAVIVRPY